MRLPKEAVAVQNDSTIEYITPAKAEKWLSKMIINRSLRDQRIIDYATEMEEGRWMLNGEGIKFDWDGVLIDGQHRLQAVILSGVTIQSRVDRNLDPACVNTIDIGTARKPADTLKMSGYANVNQLASALVFVWNYTENGSLHSKKRMSPSKSLELVAQHDLTKSLSIAESVKKILPVSRVAAFHYLASHSLADRSESFWRAVGSGEGLSSGDPALALRNKIIDLRMRSRTLPVTESLIAMMVAWNKEALGKTCKVIRLGDAKMSDDIIGAKPRLKSVK